MRKQAVECYVCEKLAAGAEAFWEVDVFTAPQEFTTVYMCKGKCWEDIQSVWPVLLEKIKRETE